MSSQNPSEDDDDPVAMTFERKYFRCGRSFVKRSLRPLEFRTGWRGLHVPRMGKERLKNEAECMSYIREHTNIPVPILYCQFEDDEACYLISEYVEGIKMSDLCSTRKKFVEEELKKHLATLKTLKSNKLGGPGGLIIPPFRVSDQTEQDYWNLQPSLSDEYVFCHNDLSQSNIIVDPDTLKINAIIDWEYAGFYPSHFEFPFYKRAGPSVAIQDEADDSLDLLKFLHSKEYSAHGRVG